MRIAAPRPKAAGLLNDLFLIAWETNPMPLPDTILTYPHLRAPKGIVYGPPGSGKTTYGASADRPLIIDCENGAAHVQCHRTPYLAS